MESDDDIRGLIGLQNLGNTCYINAALQALSNCQQLTRFVLDCPNLAKENGLSRCYFELINEIWNPRDSQYAVPTSIIRNIKCIYPAFRGCTQQDSQEFLRCFLEQLHDELKREENSIISDIFEFKIESSIICSSCNNISTTKETFKDLSVPVLSGSHPYYQQQQQQQLQQQQQVEQQQQRRPQADDGVNSVKDSYNNDEDDDCDDGSAASATYPSESRQLQSVSYLDAIPLARWLVSWLSSWGSWFWGPQVTLHDCLSVFFGTDPLEGENEYSCETCTKKNRGVKYLKILELPEVLCIHFKRYESIGSSKISTHVSFPLTGLDLAPFMCQDSSNTSDHDQQEHENDDDDDNNDDDDKGDKGDGDNTSARWGAQTTTTYDLIACICHHGSALMTGHYTTYALNCYDDQWYEFDDQYVTCVSSYQVENSEAYILFYQKSKP